MDLATPRSQREQSTDLDFILLDALLEGFDTGVPCLLASCCLLETVLTAGESWFGTFSAYHPEADSARHVVTMGKLFQHMKVPDGSLNLITKLVA